MSTGLLLIFLLAPPSPSEATQAELQDPRGDTEFYFTQSPLPDLLSVSAAVSPAGDLHLYAGFAAGTFSPSATSLQFNLQIAESESRIDPCMACGNYLVDYNGIGPASQKVEVKQLGSSGLYETVATLEPTVAADDIRITVPGRLLPKNAKRVGFRVTASVKLGDDALSIILDRAPDAGLPQGLLEIASSGRTKR